MLDSILKYISIITVAGAAISFVVGLIKYLDERKREERTKRFEMFQKLMRLTSGQGEEPGERVALTQQLAAIYQLQHFKEYKYASIPILEHTRKDCLGRNMPDVLVHALEDTLKALR
jgi:hypothetical protein